MSVLSLWEWQKEEQQFQRLYRTPRGTVATILRNAETFSKLQNVVVDLQIQRQETITYDMGLHVL